MSLGTIQNVKTHAARLVTAGLWHRVEGGYRVHDYHDHNPTAEAVRALRQERAVLGRRGGLAKAANTNKQTPSKEQAASQNNVLPDPIPSHPIPSHPLPTTESHTRAAVALAGTLPRDFRNTAWMSKRGKHVPSFLHEEFKLAIGGTPESADQRLKVFYEVVEAGWPEGPIGDDPVKLWRAQFAAKFPSVAPVSSPADRTAMLRRATEEFLK